MPSKLPFRIYEGEGLLKLSAHKAKPIVQDILYENDKVLLVAKEKVGKSILALQLACSISSATPFLGMFEVPKAHNVWYFATEGKDEDIQERLIRMNKKVPCNKKNLKLFCSNRFKFNQLNSERIIHQMLEEYKPSLPKVVIIDALYKSVAGSTIKDDVCSNFFDKVDIFVEKCDAAVFILHHAHRPIRLEGRIIDEGDDSTFGSYVLKAEPDHIFYMGYVTGTNKNKRFLKCETQRSGTIAEHLMLRLEEPDPLFFDIIRPDEESTDRVVGLLQSIRSGLTVHQIMSKTGMSRSTVYFAIGQLGNSIVKDDNERPSKYLLTGRKQ